MKGHAIKIRHIFSHAITVQVEGDTQRIWLDRDEAIQLLEMLPEAINRMALPNAEVSSGAKTP